MKRSQQAVTFRLRGAVAVLLLMLTALSGCSRQTQIEGQMLAKAGVATANNLADYYHSLSHDVLDDWEMTAYNEALLGDPPNPQLKQNFQTDLQALAARESLARQLASTYSSLLQLSSYDATGTVKTAAGGLADAVQNVVGKPFHGQGSAAPLFGDLIGELADARQSGDIKRASKVIADLLTQLSQMVRREQPVYASLERDKGDVQDTILTRLILEKKVLAQPLLASVPRSLGLTWAQPDQPLDDKTTKALVAVAQIRTQRLTLASVSAGDATGQSLEALLAQHKSLLARKPIATTDILAAVQKAQGYLDDVDKLRGGKSEGK